MADTTYKFGNDHVGLDKKLVDNGDSTYSPAAGSLRHQWTGSGWEREQGNTEGTLLALAARTAQVISADITNPSARGIMLMVDITAASGTGGIRPVIQAKDALGNYFDLALNVTAKTTTGKAAYILYPTATSIANDVAVMANGVLPRNFRVVMTVGDASSYTYSLCYALLL